MDLSFKVFTLSKQISTMKSQEDILHCKSCAATLSGTYCGQCGQKVIQHRITMRMVFAEAFNEITNVDRGLLYTFFMLLKKPDQVVLDYLAGRTIKYASPFKYLLFWTAISTLIYIGFGFYDQQVAGMDGLVPSSDDREVNEVGALYNEWMKQNFQLVSIIYIPLFALFTRYFFKKSGLNYAEHLVANAYFSAQASIVFMPVFLFRLNIELSSSLSILIMILYYTFTIRSLFNQSWLAAFLKTIVIYLLSMLLFVVLFSMVAVPLVFLTRH